MSRGEKFEFESDDAGRPGIVVQKDWILGTDRNTEALDRILVAASDLVSRNGFEGFSIDALADQLNCSPATIYRHGGGKAAILERLLSLFSYRVIGAVRQAIAGTEGTARLTTAIIVALDSIRAEPLGTLIMGAARPDSDSRTITASPLVATLAEEIIGTADPLAAQWLIRVTFALWYWPVRDKQTEYELVNRFAAPSVFLGSADDSA